MGIFILVIFLIPLFSLGDEYANGIVTAKYFRFAEVVGIGSMVMWAAAWSASLRFGRSISCFLSVIRQFFNPGPYSGFLVVILPVALHVMPMVGCKLPKILLFIRESKR